LVRCYERGDFTSEEISEEFHNALLMKGMYKI